ncbi:hypothetical protein CB0940_00981 [Cercospora beticola]|uniref:Methyltransferase domain-containing protein n=1 Tax=Cercospora beticola TaxID=122368 RepID=A0A2G5I9P2_CERBT|nr:hypothetical protein CB0940_00981 [Cercospora beticola]PIB01508.1 hypothetical protein CB0940_00981 [Cercospora beticola]WPA96405.1 hypothetical protein RHO25_001012 [Cercospora beticola]CAK1355276.1 unnamed protein product [Cercospora beticola]
MGAASDSSRPHESSLQDYLLTNKANWNERATLHAVSKDYDAARLVSDASAISDVVSFDLPLLGDISGYDCVHLQCHIGTDTLSLVRLGAKSVVGLDFSTAAVREAQDIANRAGFEQAKLKYVEADAYHAVSVLGAGAFDMVFTGIGAICWLPSIRQWAQQVSGLLKPGGRLFIREGHPVVWSIDETILDARGPVITYPYFETTKPVESESEDTYVDTDGKKLTSTKSVSWNHGIGEILTALLEVGMEITGFVEHKTIPWVAFPGKMEKDTKRGEWKLIEGEDNVPLSYTLQAKKK